VALNVTFRWHDSLDAIAPVMHSNGHRMQITLTKHIIFACRFIARCLLLRVFAALLSFRVGPMLLYVMYMDVQCGSVRFGIHDQRF
jgi:hypothetical protein